MDDIEPKQHKQSLLTRPFDWMGVSEKRRLSVRKFLRWFKKPSNLLSLAAIVAVIIVPWIEKIVKSDEDLRAKIDLLLEATNRVVDTNQQRVAASAPGLSGNLQYEILSAKRENELERATAIARSIKHEVYPAILFALSNELCSSGKFEDAQEYLREVLKRGTGIHFLSPRPSAPDLSSAHVISALCYGHRFRVQGHPEDKRLANEQMSAAADELQRDKNQDLGQLAIVYVEWAELGETLGDPAASKANREKAREIAKRMPFIDHALISIVGQDGPSEPPSPPAIGESDLPRSSEGDTYKVSFPNSPDDSGVFLFPPADNLGHYSASGTLFVYKHNLFVSEYDVYTIYSTDDKKHLTRLEFVSVVPFRVPTNVPNPRISLVWTIEKVEGGIISGVQSETGKPPKGFLAKFSAGQGSTTTAQSVN